MNLVWDSLDLHHRGPKGCPQEAEPSRYGWQVGHGCIRDALLGQNIREIVQLEEESGMLEAGLSSVSADCLFAEGCDGF